MPLEKQSTATLNTQHTHRLINTFKVTETLLGILLYSTLMSIVLKKVKVLNTFTIHQSNLIKNPEQIHF